VRLSSLFRQRYNVNVLSAARFFLFGSRDMWFEVPLPFFLRDASHGLGWERVAVGAALAVSPRAARERAAREARGAVHAAARRTLCVCVCVCVCVAHGVPACHG
jgi:hypothetical protein